MEQQDWNSAAYTSLSMKFGVYMYTMSIFNLSIDVSLITGLIVLSMFYIVLGWFVFYQNNDE